MGKKKYNFKSVTSRDFNLVRRIHISLLATPKDRVLKPWPDPKLERTLPAPVAPAAMRAKPSERTIMLFKSKKIYTEGKKYEPPKKPQHYVELPALKAVASARTARLALPKRISTVKKKISKRALAKQKKKCLAFKKARDAWLKSRAAPKRIFLAPPEPERQYSFPMRKWPTQTRNQRIERINLLAQPARRRSKKPTVPKNLGKVVYLPATDRIRELALPRRIPSETLRNMKYKPGEMKRNVLRAVASERTKALAVPRPRSKAVDNDVREDAFTISPAALTYKASRRIIDLAKPRKIK